MSLCKIHKKYELCPHHKFVNDLYNVETNFPSPVPTINGKCRRGKSKCNKNVWLKKPDSDIGKLQSPIALSSFKSNSHVLPALELIGYHDFLPLQLKIDNHTVAMEMNKKLMKIPLPYIFGAMLGTNKKYELEGLHFHWGTKNNRGSEHTLNNIRFPMEMHIVHRNTAYSNFSTALNHEDGLSVLGIFFQLQEGDNEVVCSILQSLMDIQWNDKQIETDISFRLASLMPDNTDIFYTYKGSLTTYPYSEVVTWIVFPTPVPISYKQMKQFRELIASRNGLTDNYREIQHIGRRIVYYRKLHLYSETEHSTMYSNISHLKWIAQ